MSSLATYCVDLGLPGLLPEACQQYLEIPNGHNDDNVAIDLPLIEFNVLNEVTKYICDNIDEIAKDRENIADIKRVAACALSNAVNAKDCNGNNCSNSYLLITSLDLHRNHRLI